MSDSKEKKFYRVRPVDRFGNTIRPGLVMYWGKIDAVVRVLDVKEGGERDEGMGEGEVAPQRVVFAVEIPFSGQEPHKVASFKDFMAILNPEDELRTENILKKVEKADKVLELISNRED
jgi:hypothetical protein